MGGLLHGVDLEYAKGFMVIRQAADSFASKQRLVGWITAVKDPPHIISKLEQAILEECH